MISSSLAVVVIVVWCKTKGLASSWQQQVLSLCFGCNFYAFSDKLEAPARSTWDVVPSCTDVAPSRPARISKESNGNVSSRFLL
jgi:hypothetical protein